MNCKKGDMAWIVAPPRELQTPWAKASHMKIVKCVEIWHHPHSGRMMWKIEPTISFMCGSDHLHTIEAVIDACLRPINGDPLPGSVEPKELEIA